jgi:hypothetical protein
MDQQYRIIETASDCFWPERLTAYQQYVGFWPFRKIITVQEWLKLDVFGDSRIPIADTDFSPKVPLASFDSLYKAREFIFRNHKDRIIHKEPKIHHVS